MKPKAGGLGSRHCGVNTDPLIHVVTVGLLEVCVCVCVCVCVYACMWVGMFVLARIQSFASWRDMACSGQKPKFQTTGKTLYPVTYSPSSRHICSNLVLNFPCLVLLFLSGGLKEDGIIFPVHLLCSWVTALMHIYTRAHWSSPMTVVRG